MDSRNILTRGLSTDNKINLIFGVFTIIIGVLSIALGWAMWRLMERPRRLRHESPSLEPIPLETGPSARTGYELTLRFGRND